MSSGHVSASHHIVHVSASPPFFIYPTSSVSQPDIEDDSVKRIVHTALGGFPIYYVPSSSTVSKRTTLEEPGTDPSRGVLLHTVLDEGT